MITHGRGVVSSPERAQRTASWQTLSPTTSSVSHPYLKVDKTMVHGVEWQVQKCETVNVDEISSLMCIYFKCYRVLYFATQRTHQCP